MPERAPNSKSARDGAANGKGCDVDRITCRRDRGAGLRRRGHFNRHSPDSYRVVRHLPRFRVLGNPAPLARAVDGDGTSRRHAER